MVSLRNVIGVATDTASTDYGQSTDFETHQILGEANIWAIENLANAEALPETGRSQQMHLSSLDLPFHIHWLKVSRIRFWDLYTGYTIYNMVHKLDDGSGGPSRVFAMPSHSSAWSISAADKHLWIFAVITTKLCF